MQPTITELRTLQHAAIAKSKQNHNEKPERNLEMIRLRYVDGMTLDAIGKKYGITRQRVNQIVTKPL